MGLKAATAAVVSAHKSYPTLELCLGGLMGVVARPADLIFVDNGSAEGLASAMGAKFPGITTLRLPENRLFCGGYNAGIRLALERGYDFILLANADSEIVNPAFLDSLLEAAGRRREAAFLGPQVYFRSRAVVQPTTLRFPSLFRHLAIWIPFRLARKRFGRMPGHEAEAEFLNGVCVLCRAEALRQIGLMDESFGAYLEDADWAWRARHLGWSSLYVPVPSLIHHEERTGYEHHSFKSFLLKRNMVLWFLKTGRPKTAAVYAFLSIGLARLRSWKAPDSEKTLHREFSERLRLAYAELLTSARPAPLPAEMPACRPENRAFDCS